MFRLPDEEDDEPLVGRGDAEGVLDAWLVESVFANTTAALAASLGVSGLDLSCLLPAATAVLSSELV